MSLPASQPAKYYLKLSWIVYSFSCQWFSVPFAARDSFLMATAQTKSAHFADSLLVAAYVLTASV